MIAAKNELDRSTNENEYLKRNLSASQNHVDWMVNRNSQNFNKLQTSTESNSLNNLSSKFHSDLSNLTWNLNTFKELNRMRKHSNCLNPELKKLSFPFVDEITGSSEPKDFHLSLHDFNNKNQSAENFKTHSLINSRKQSLSKTQVYKKFALFLSFLSLKTIFKLFHFKKNLIDVNRVRKEPNNMNNQGIILNLILSN